MPIQIALAIILTFHFLRSPFFVQPRVGQGERIFHLVKFRTMRIDHDEQSLTRLGRFIRSCSLDELPQLINVLIGNMSFVGPRPLLVSYLPYYNSSEKQRHEVLPGITGLAQVSGRNQIDWERRMELDVFYVKHRSFLLDIKILAKTMIEVFKRDLTSYANDKTIPFSEYASKR